MLLYFTKSKKPPGTKYLWLCVTGSTPVSQLVDSYIVLFIAFTGIVSWQLILAVGIMNYLYKFFMAIILTPVIYFIEKRMANYVAGNSQGNEKSCNGPRQGVRKYSGSRIMVEG